MTIRTALLTSLLLLSASPALAWSDPYQQQLQQQWLFEQQQLRSQQWQQQQDSDYRRRQEQLEAGARCQRRPGACPTFHW